LKIVQPCRSKRSRRSIHKFIEYDALLNLILYTPQIVTEAFFSVKSTPFIPRTALFRTKVNTSHKMQPLKKTPNDVKSITMSDEERRNRKYSPETLVKVLNALTQDGLVVLKDAIPVEIIDEINDKMCGDTDARLNDPSQRFNHGIKCE
jgi:hypothetical protein